MDDLISRSALMEKSELILDANYDDYIVVYEEDIKNAPAVDAVEVVRCEKCIHYEMGVCLKIYSDGAVSEYAWQERKPDDFCSYGKRREENATG